MSGSAGPKTPVYRASVGRPPDIAYLKHNSCSYLRMRRRNPRNSPTAQAKDARDTKVVGSGTAL